MSTDKQESTQPEKRSPALIAKQINSLPQELQDLISLYPKLQGFDIDQLDDFYDTAKNFAPNVMKNPLVLSCFLVSHCQMDFIDLPTIKLLIDTERAFKTL